MLSNGRTKSPFELHKIRGIQTWIEFKFDRKLHSADPKKKCNPNLYSNFAYATCRHAKIPYYAYVSCSFNKEPAEFHDFRYISYINTLRIKYSSNLQIGQTVLIKIEFNGKLFLVKYLPVTAKHIITFHLQRRRKSVILWWPQHFSCAGNLVQSTLKNAPAEE
jgi:hypothetical protein